ncbi:hypothetical protein KEM48_002134 [Puccinia striiformis f. sp. tritici PST-130]|nr:hypothetical protein KEM48_002134 [Puccinia striiformis f. sp. tritici PST-130]
MQHINFGMVAGMSTRKVTSVHLEDMMNEDRNTMHDQIKTNIDNYNKIPDPLKTADEFGISGNKIQDMVGLTVMSTNGIKSFPSRETQDHTYNETLIVKGQDQQTALARLWLYRSCGDILANAMKLFTLDPLDHILSCNKL